MQVMYLLGEEMNNICNKQYDKYGNLVVDISIESFNCNLSNNNQSKDLYHLFYINQINNINLGINGYFKIMQYDHYNNIILEESVIYEDTCYKEITRYYYSYSNDGQILSKVRISNTIILSFSDMINVELKKHRQDIISNVEYITYKFDKQNNIVMIKRYLFSLPNDIIEFNPDDFMIPDNADVEINRYFNKYNKKDELIEVFRYDEINIKSNMISSLNYTDLLQGVVESQMSYSNGKLNEKKILNGFLTDDYNIKIKYIYDHLGKLKTEEYYSLSDIPLKIIEYKIIDNRICKNVISPMNDNFKWHSVSFEEDGVCNIDIHEPIITPNLMKSIYEYALKYGGNKVSLFVSMGWNGGDRSMFFDENNEIQTEYFENHKITWTDLPA
jgi:hypothetical protein